MFLMNEELQAVDEDYSRPDRRFEPGPDTNLDDRPDTRESKRLKENTSPAPLLPEIGSLRGGRFSGGDLGWDEQAFKEP